MSQNRTIVAFHHTECVPRHIRNARLDERAHGSALGGLEKQPARSDELERVPFDRVVAGREHQAAGRVVMLHRQLAGRRGREPDIHHRAPHRLQRAHRDAVEHGAGHPTVPTQHHGARRCPPTGPRRRRPRRTARPPRASGPHQPARGFPIHSPSARRGPCVLLEGKPKLVRAVERAKREPASALHPLRPALTFRRLLRRTAP